MSEDLPPCLKRLPALSIRQPWAWMILHGSKDVENRSWETEYRGKFLIHASKTWNKGDYLAAVSFARRNCDIERVPEFKHTQTGGLIGIATLDDCKKGLDSPWYFQDHWGWMLRDIMPLPFIPCPGQQKFFHPTFDGEGKEAIRKHLPEYLHAAKSLPKGDLS